MQEALAQILCARSCAGLNPVRRSPILCTMSVVKINCCGPRQLHYRAADVCGDRRRRRTGARTPHAPEVALHPWRERQEGDGGVEGTVQQPLPALGPEVQRYGGREVQPHQHQGPH